MVEYAVEHAGVPAGRTGSKTESGGALAAYFESY
jgi:hypothetical protein